MIYAPLDDKSTPRLPPEFQWYSPVSLQCGPIYHDITYGTAMTAAERKSHFKLTTHTPYLALTGKLWGVYYEDFGANWPCYYGTALYFDLVS